jgi:N-succinyldiaminopimelate aminotransferase
VNPRLARLHAYPFERLAALKAGIRPADGLSHIAMSIGEPQHAPPRFVLDVLHENLHRLGSYPATAGLPELRTAAAQFLERRFALNTRVDPDTMVLPVNGTREGLFSFVQAIVDDSRGREPVVAMPNPFYQIYEGATLLARAEALYLTSRGPHLPDLDAVPAELWQRCQLLFLCTPGNPSGAVLPLDYLRHALRLAAKHDFVVACDECYSDIYLQEAAPSPGLLQAALAEGHNRFERCVVFHSLSKRSSVPGMRSGFVAGDPAILKSFLLYRTYHGSAMAVPTQLASIAAWNEDAHAASNRHLYQEKFAQVIPVLAGVLPVETPDGAFYLWTRVGEDDEHFTRDLYAACNVTVLPGSYLARPSGATASNPGAGYVRISLVPDLAQCIEAARRIAQFANGRH